MMRALLHTEAARSVSGIDLSPLAGKRVLVTGASGLIGTYFIEGIKAWCSKTDADVEVIGLCASEPDTWWKNIFDGKNFRWIRGDLTNYSFRESLPTVDYVIHAAGYGQPGKFLLDPVKTIELNTTATVDLFRKISDEGRLFFVSTSEVYVGSDDPQPDENEIGVTNTDWPRASYIEGKRSGEAICHAFKKQSKQSRIARLALGYGPGTRSGDQRVLHSFIERALRDGKITLMDHGQASRTYCYVTDAVEMMWNIFLHGKHATYNVGGISKTTIAKLAMSIGQILNVPVEFPKELPQISTTTNGAPTDVSMNISRYLSEFHKTSFVSLDDGLRKTIEWQTQFWKGNERAIV